MNLWEIWENRNGVKMFVAEKDNAGFKCRHLDSYRMTRATAPKRGWSLVSDKYSKLAQEVLVDCRQCLSNGGEIKRGLRIFDPVRDKYKGYGRVTFSDTRGWRHTPGDFEVTILLKINQKMELYFDRPTTVDVMTASFS